MYILSLHPILQVCTVATVYYVFSLGLKRFLQQQLGKSIVFPWKRHVFWGKTAIILVMLGYASGLAAVYYTFRVIGFTGDHHDVAEALFPLLFFGFASGWFMDSRKKKRKVLPLLHGVNNLLVVLLFAFQVFSGLRLVLLYFFGR